MARSILILVVILWIGALGCYTQIAHHANSSDTEQGESVSQVIPDDGLKLDLRVEPLIVERGETLFLELTLTNTSSETVTRQSSSGCIYGFSILTPEGIRVAPEPKKCAIVEPIPGFKPGEVVVVRMKWRWRGHSIPPGRYVVRAGFGEFGMEDSAPPIEIELR
jgi:hypothetical protein